MLQQMGLESIILHVKATHKSSNIIQFHFYEVSRIVRLIGWGEERIKRFCLMGTQFHSFFFQLTGLFYSMLFLFFAS